MPERPEVAVVPENKKLAVFLDGTWNAVADNTNVWRMKSLCATASSEGAPQLVYYDIGVNGFFGGMVGKGLSQNVREAYEWLIDNYNPGDDVFIFGFSRGAYTARSLSGLIAKHGLLKPGSPLGVAQLYERYKRSDDRTLWKLGELQAAGTLLDVTLEEQWMLKYSQPIRIKMVGVWDTVGALGIPAFSIEGISRSTLGFLHTGLRLSIENGYHALAIDEHRRAFAPTLWSVRKPKDPDAVFAAPRSISSIEQRWFVGAHANVGGGCLSDLLAQIPLRWIMKKASVHGLAFRSDVELDGDVLGAPISDSYKDFMSGAYCKMARRHYRPIGGDPQEREDGTHRNVNETIDSSVFDRWRDVPRYRPPNLSDWAKRKSVDPGSFRQSVNANDPKLGAPD
jgi:uncharacterized protein (DUF2235 family)